MEPPDGGRKFFTANQPHGVKRPAVGVGSPPVHRHDPRMFEVGGDLGLEQESFAAHRAVRVLGSDLLESDLAVQLGVLGHVDLSQSSPGVRPEHAKPRTRARHSST